MSEVVIIIPTRLAATRLPNKPLLKIDGKEMILHVFERANQVKNAKTIIATPDKEIHELIQAKGGLSYLTEKNHETGTDRVFEVYEKMFKFVPEIIINLQGDMPNIVTSDIENLINYMKTSKTLLATLASDLTKEELTNSNVVKVEIKNSFEQSQEFKKAIDFFRVSDNLNRKTLYHHIGIYAFKKDCLKKFVNLPRSKMEKERNLEQLRAFENDIEIKVGYVKNMPLSVDTAEDLQAVKKIMENSNG